MTIAWRLAMNNAGKGKRKKNSGTEGSSLLETALVVPILLLLVAGAVDLGRAYTTAIEVEAAAHAGALYGAQNPTDRAGMEAATENQSNLSGLTSTASYGCECADGSSAVPSCGTIPDCPDNYVDYVSVTATAQFVPLLRYPGLPSSLQMSSTSHLRAGGD